MSKGYLYDTGDELITRDGNEKFPTFTENDEGKVLVVDPEGKVVADSGDLYIPVSYDSANKRVDLESGFKTNTIKSAVTAGKQVYFIVKIVTGGATTTKGSGPIWKVTYSSGNNNYFGFFAMPLVMTSDANTQTIVWGSYAGLVSDLPDNLTYISLSENQIVTLINTPAT